MNLEKVNKTLIKLLILIQPFVMIFQTVALRDIQILGFSFFEMINLFLSFISVVLTIYLYKDKKKFLIYIPYVVLLGIYLVLHYLNMTQFDTTIYPAHQADLLRESYYIIKLFMVPLILLFNLIYNHFKKKDIVQLIYWISLIISVSIIGSNLLKISFLSYGDDSLRNTVSILQWPVASTIDFSLIATKGFFYSANQISGILFMIFPIILFDTYKYGKKKNYALLILQIIAMQMLGTRVASLGCILIFLLFIGVWLVIDKAIWRKKTNIMNLTIVFLISILLFSISPLGYKMKKEYLGIDSGSSSNLLASLQNRVNSKGETIDLEKLAYDIERFQKINCNTLSSNEEEFVLRFVESYKGNLGMPEYILKNYDVAQNTKFWCGYLQTANTNDYRFLKTSVLKNIYNEHNSTYDRWFGLGNGLNFIYTESDYSYQFYTYGIIGLVLFVAPYFFLILKKSKWILCKIKTRLTSENIMYLAAPALGLLIAYYSGHILERIFPLLMVSLVMALSSVEDTD